MLRFIPVAVVLLAVACGGGTSATPTSSPEPTLTFRALPPPPLTDEEKAWYCADAWGALSDEQADRYYGTTRYRVGEHEVPDRILSLVDQYCFDDPRGSVHR